jgi:hypothetical protein
MSYRSMLQDAVVLRDQVIHHMLWFRLFAENPR